MVPQLPIFELPLVLLPGERLPLHIFEERYKRMISASLETGEPFGVLLRDDDGARSLGCTAHVTEVLERLEDGRLNVIVTGGLPFRVLDRFDDLEDPSAEIEVISEDEPSSAAEGEAEEARAVFAELAEQAGGDRPAAEDLASENAYGLAARVELPADTKQELLSVRDEGERLRILTETLRKLQRLLARSEEVAERASSNGKIRIEP